MVRPSAIKDRKSTRLNSSRVATPLSLHDALPISAWPKNGTAGCARNLHWPSPLPSPRRDRRPRTERPTLEALHVRAKLSRYRHGPAGPVIERRLDGPSLRDQRSEEHTSELQSRCHPSLPTRRSSDLSLAEERDSWVREELTLALAATVPTAGSAPAD